MRADTVDLFDNQATLPSFITRRDRKNSRAERRKDKQKPETSFQHNLKSVAPLTENQHLTFDAFEEGKNLLLHGVAGTGKTFIALWLALDSVIRGEIAKPVVIIRSVVPSRDMGFLPGTSAEKSAVYEEPYRALCTEYTGKPHTYDLMKTEGLIQFSTTSFLRGLTFRNNIILVDECQNCSGRELNTIMTRVGEGCRVIFCGDFRQSDLNNHRDDRDFQNFMNIVHQMPSFTSIEFQREDIVRSGLVREYIETMDRLNIQF